MDTRLAPQRTIAMWHRAPSITGFIDVDGNGNGQLGVRHAGTGVTGSAASGCSHVGRILWLAG